MTIKKALPAKLLFKNAALIQCRVVNYHFLSCANDAHLSKPHVPRRRQIRPIFLLDYYNIDGTVEGCRVYFIVETLDVRQQPADVIHPDAQNTCETLNPNAVGQINIVPD